jgi:hypothetical protein
MNATPIRSADGQSTSPPGFLPLAILTAVITVLTNLVHEAGHAVAGKVLGYTVFVNINSSGNVSEDYRSVADATLVDAAGPVTTILVALIALISVRENPRDVPLTIIFCAFAMRLLAAVASLTGPNDEARISMTLGLGYWTLHSLSIIVLLMFFVLGLRVQPVRWTWFAVTIPVIMATVVAIVIGEQAIPSLII